MAYPSVNFQPTSSFAGLQPINIASTTQAHVLGTVIRARDVNYGEGEFVYLMGVADTAAGDAVCYNSKTGVTVRAVAAGATSIGAFAVAMAATLASQYGWYQISGSGPINATTTAANTQAYLTATAGQIDDTGTTPISGLTITASTSAGFATVQLDRPAVNPADDGTFMGDVTLTTGVLTSGVANSGTNTAFTLNSAALTGTTNLLKVSNNGTPKFVVDNAGSVTATEAILLGQVSASRMISTPPYTDPVQLLGLVSDGAAAVGVFSDNIPVLANATAHLFEFKNNSVVQAFVGINGTIELSIVGAGFILKSPDGTRYKIVVANGGALSATAA